MPSYKIVYSRSLIGGQTEETFTIADPVDSFAVEAAVRAYVENRCKVYGVTAKVYPAAVEPLMEVGKSAPARSHDQFNTPDSTWIDHVSWERKNSSLCVHFLRGGYIIYKSDWLTFENFKLWVAAGGSAGEYVNANLKGSLVLKKM